MSLKIKESAKGKPLEIQLNVGSSGNIELWINDELSYLSPQELVILFKMVKEAGHNLFT